MPGIELAARTSSGEEEKISVGERFEFEELRVLYSSDLFDDPNRSEATMMDPSRHL